MGDALHPAERLPEQTDEEHELMKALFVEQKAQASNSRSFGVSRSVVTRLYRFR